MSHYLFTSESVGIGHPDKVCDQISDAILDACLIQDPEARVAVETMVTAGFVVLAGEITTTAKIDPEKIARETIREIGYTDSSLGFDYYSCGIITALHQQSPDIARGLTDEKHLGAGDQGIMFGYACDETPELMPLPIMLSHRLVQLLKEKRERGHLLYLRPDAKAQVTIEYSEDHVPVRVHTVVLSTQHHEEVDHGTIYHDMVQLIEDHFPSHLLDGKTRFYINPTGRFVIGGPAGDSGLTGRKIIVDTYGGRGHHGGGAFSGKDPTKVDRSATYAARYVAKNIVAAGLARRCDIQISYAIGIPHPISLKVDTYGTGTVTDKELIHLIQKNFTLSPGEIIQMLNLRRPIYKVTAFGGHFGRHEPSFTWEKTIKIS